MELILTDFMQSSVGNSFTTEGGKEACVTFTNCWMVRDPITYTLKYHKNVTFTTTYVDPMYTNQMLQAQIDPLILISELYERMEFIRRNY